MREQGHLGRVLRRPGRSPRVLSSRRRDSELCWHESALLSSFKSLNPNLSLPCYCSMFSKGRECQLFPILLTDTPWHADSVFIKHRGFLSRAGSLEHTDCGDSCPCTFSRAVTGPQPALQAVWALWLRGLPSESSPLRAWAGHPWSPAPSASSCAGGSAVWCLGRGPRPLRLGLRNPGKQLC